jgi:hypothetical protein
MKTKKAMLVLLFILFCSLSTPCSAQENVKIPIAELVEKVYKLENVIEGTVVTHDFILKNKGNADLIINQVKSG